jgi:hypothetical protein
MKASCKRSSSTGYSWQDMDICVGVCAVPQKLGWANPVLELWRGDVLL